MSGPGRVGRHDDEALFAVYDARAREEAAREQAVREQNRRLGREPRLIGLDLRIEVGEARLSLYLDDHGELLIDEWTGTAEVGAIIEALEKALEVVGAFGGESG